MRIDSKGPVTFTEGKLIRVAWAGTNTSISWTAIQLKLSVHCLDLWSPATQKVYNPTQMTIIKIFVICANNYIHVCLPVLMCWRASARFWKPIASHWLVLSKYVAAMTGRVVRIMFCSPQPAGCWIRVPIDCPLIAFSTSADTCSLPACRHRNRHLYYRHNIIKQKKETTEQTGKGPFWRTRVTYHLPSLNNTSYLTCHRDLCAGRCVWSQIFFRNFTVNNFFLDTAWRGKQWKSWEIS